MHNNRIFTYVGVAAAVALALAAAGVPLTRLIPLAVVLACPLMMFFMMGNMHRMHGGHREEHSGGGAPRSTVSGDQPSRQR